MHLKKLVLRKESLTPLETAEVDGGTIIPKTYLKTCFSLARTCFPCISYPKLTCTCPTD